VIVDTSAILAILFGEPEADAFALAIRRAARRSMSAASYVEAAIRVDRLNSPVAGSLLDDLVSRLGIAIEAVTAEQAYIARAAYRRFGRGSGHPARLNFGDCLTYALSRAAGEPLLFKGDDFGRTDIVAVIPADQQ
jgi:ribonuclease VapC